jgi:hypothetical protein
MADTQFIKTLHDQRNRAATEARNIIEHARIAGRATSAEEQVAYERANANVNELDATIAEWRSDALSRAQANRARASVESIVRATRTRSADTSRTGSLRNETES